MKYCDLKIKDCKEIKQLQKKYKNDKKILSELKRNSVLLLNLLTEHSIEDFRIKIKDMLLQLGAWRLLKPIERPKEYIYEKIKYRKLNENVHEVANKTDVYRAITSWKKEVLFTFPPPILENVFEEYCSNFNSIMDICIISILNTFKNLGHPLFHDEKWEEEKFYLLGDMWNNHNEDLEKLRFVSKWIELYYYEKI